MTLQQIEIALQQHAAQSHNSWGKVCNTLKRVFDDWALEEFYGFKYGKQKGDFTNIKSMKDAYANPKAVREPGTRNYAYPESTSNSYASDLESALSQMGNGSLLGATQKIAAARKIVERESAGEKMDLDSPEDRKLLKLIGLNSTSEDWNKSFQTASDIVKSAGQKGILFTGSIFGAETPEDIMKAVDQNPKAFLKEPFLSDYKNAPHAKDKKMALIIGAMSSGGVTSKWDNIPKNVPQNSTAANLVALATTQETGARKTKEILRLASEGRIDPSSITIMAASSLVEAATALKEAAVALHPGKVLGATADNIGTPLHDIHQTAPISVSPFNNQQNRGRR